MVASRLVALRKIMKGGLRDTEVLKLLKIINFIVPEGINPGIFFFVHKEVQLVFLTVHIPTHLCREIVGPMAC